MRTVTKKVTEVTLDRQDAIGAMYVRICVGGDTGKRPTPVRATRYEWVEGADHVRVFGFVRREDQSDGRETWGTMNLQAVSPEVRFALTAAAQMGA